MMVRTQYGGWSDPLVPVHGESDGCAYATRKLRFSVIADAGRDHTHSCVHWRTDGWMDGCLNALAGARSISSTRIGDAEEIQVYWGGGVVGTVLVILLVLFLLGKL